MVRLLLGILWNRVFLRGVHGGSAGNATPVEECTISSFNVEDNVYCMKFLRTFYFLLVSPLALLCILQRTWGLLVTDVRSLVWHASR